MKKFFGFGIAALFAFMACLGLVGCDNGMAGAEDNMPKEGITLPQETPSIEETKPMVEQTAPTVEETEPTGAVYLLQDAYYRGMITSEAIELIACLYSDDVQSNKTLDPLVEQTIKDTLAFELRNAKYPNSEAKSEGFAIIRYYGEYDGYYAFMEENRYTPIWKTSEQVKFGNITIDYPNTNRIKIYKNIEKEISEPSGKIYSLQTAYDNGLITKADVEQIAYNYKNRTIVSEKLNPSIELKIKETLAYNITKDGYWDFRYYGGAAKPSGFSIEGFYGEYNGCYAIQEGHNLYYLWSADATIHRIEVAEVEFVYCGSGPRIMIWKSNQ